MTDNELHTFTYSFIWTDQNGTITHDAGLNSITVRARTEPEACKLAEKEAMKVAGPPPNEQHEKAMRELGAFARSLAGDNTYNEEDFQGTYTLKLLAIPDVIDGLDWEKNQDEFNELVRQLTPDK